MSGRSSPEYTAWYSMIRRCTNPKAVGYEHYGARGITVCERWMSLDNFIADMGRRPSPDLSLDRIDNDGNYEPGNCRWATRSQQNLNKRPSTPKLAAENTQKTHCKYGHLLSGDNLRMSISKGRPTRCCRACARRLAQEYRDRKAAPHA